VVVSFVIDATGQVKRPGGEFHPFRVEAAAVAAIGKCSSIPVARRTVRQTRVSQKIAFNLRRSGTAPAPANWF